MKEVVNQTIRKQLLKVILYGIFIGIAIYFIGEYFLQEKKVMNDALFVWALFILLLMVMAWVVSRFKFLTIGTDNIRMQSSILNIRETRIAYDRITHSKFNQTFMERVLMIGTIQIDTAETNAVEMISECMLKRDATELLELIDKKSSEVRITSYHGNSVTSKETANSDKRGY